VINQGSIDMCSLDGVLLEDLMKELEAIALESCLHWWRHGDLMPLKLIKPYMHALYMNQSWGKQA